MRVKPWVARYVFSTGGERRFLFVRAAGPLKHSRKVCSRCKRFRRAGCSSKARPTRSKPTAVLRSHPLAGNTFTGTTELEFFNAQSTTWSDNSLPSSGVCVDNISSDKGSSVPKSTFTGSSGLPSEC